MWAADGWPLPVDHLSDKLTSSIACVDGQLIQLIEDPQLPGNDEGANKKAAGPMIVKAVSLVSGESAWQVELPAGSRFAMPRSTELVAYDAARNLYWIDLTNGERRTLGTVPEDGEFKLNAMTLSRAVQFLADDHCVYLISQSNPTNQNQNEYYFDNLGAGYFPVNGTMVAFNKLGSRSLWKQKLDRQQLAVSSLNGMPVLVFMSARQRNENFEGVSFFHNTLKLVLLDKLNGTQLLDHESVTQYGNGWQMEFDAKAQLLTIKSYNCRLQIQPQAKLPQAREGELSLLPDGSG